MSSPPDTTETVLNAKVVAPPVRRTWLALLGLATCLAGLASYMVFIGNAMLRATGASGFFLLIVGIAIGWIAAHQDRRRWLRIVLGLDIALLVLYGAGLFGLTTLPAAPEFEKLASPPDFILPDHTGRSVKLSEAYAAGPVLLVFYRGFW